MADVEVERTGDGVATVTINRPERRNAMSDEVLRLLPEAAEELDADPEVRAVVVTGSGGSFCAGVDLGNSTAFELASFEDTEDWLRDAQAGAIAIHRMETPTIAAIEGPAAGAGLGLALACDIRIAAPDVRLGTPFIRMALTPDFGVSYHLPRVVGPAAALDMLLTARFVEADEALRLGLVSRVEPDVLDAALTTARTIAAMPPRAVRATRRLIHRNLGLDAETAILQEEIAGAATSLRGQEFAGRFAEYRDRILRAG